MYFSVVFIDVFYHDHMSLKWPVYLLQSSIMRFMKKSWNVWDRLRLQQALWFSLTVPSHKLNLVNSIIQILYVYKYYLCPLQPCKYQVFLTSICIPFGLVVTHMYIGICQNKCAFLNYMVSKEVWYPRVCWVMHAFTGT